MIITFSMRFLRRRGLFALAAADDSVSSLESDEIRKISKALLMSHKEFIEVRKMYRDKLAVLQGLKPR